MIKAVKSIINDYASAYDNYLNELEAITDHLNKNLIINSGEYVQRYKAAKDNFNLKVRAAREESLERAMVILDDAIAMIRIRVSESSGTAINDEIILLNLATTVNQEEINSFAAKFKNNYMASKILKDIANKHNLELEFVPIKDQIEVIEDLRGMVKGFFSSFKGSKHASYNANLLLKGSYIDDLDAGLSEFIEKFQ